MAKISPKILQWRREQPRGKIMKPATFQSIKKKSMKEGLSEERATKVAGKAYWSTVKVKASGRARGYERRV